MFGVRLCRWAVCVSVHRATANLQLNTYYIILFSNIICKQHNTQAAAKVIVLLSYGVRLSAASENFRSCIVK